MASGAKVDCEAAACKEVVGGLKQFLNSPDLADVKINVSYEGETRQFYGHRVILAAGSDFFRAMFAGPFQEASIREIALNDLDIGGFEVLLEYLYTATADIPPGTELAVLVLAQRFQCHGLTVFANQSIMEAMSPARVCSFLSSCIDFQAQSTAERCMSYIARNLQAVLAEQDFVNLPSSFVLELVQSEQIAVEEIQLFLALVRWGEANRGDNPLPQFLAPMLEHIRIGAMQAQELRDVVFPLGIVDPQRISMAALDLACHTVVADYAALPMWMKPRSAFGFHKFDPKHCNVSCITVSPNGFLAIANAGTRWCSVACARILRSGVHYIEVKATFAKNPPAHHIVMLGCVHAQDRPTAATVQGSFASARGYMFQMHNKTCYSGFSIASTPSAAGGNPDISASDVTTLDITPDDRVGCVLNLNEQTIEFKVNDRSLGIAYRNIPPGPYVFCCDLYGTAQAEIIRNGASYSEVEETDDTVTTAGAAAAADAADADAGPADFEEELNMFPSFIPSPPQDNEFQFSEGEEERTTSFD
eukprot:TRINITY_DN4339_c0_g1_i1.p1 TRINITY_DN4339_c0_g1~~TRINITY_DN4339_c0_g1_i1.p1  ORF type:complete len:532 (+),score=99.35 TRINITY_DN4339_c0_g1_i1:200-1795(+)